MYSAQEVADILNKTYKTINKRTINYYAFEKKMFEVNGGKNCFTEEEINKIENIILLKEKTSYTLEQIKQIINTKTNEEIKSIIGPDKIIKTVIIDPEGEYKNLVKQIGGQYIESVSSIESVFNNSNSVDSKEFEIKRNKNDIEKDIINHEGIINKIFNELEAYIDSSYKMSDELFSDLNSTINLTDNTRNIINKYKKGE